MIERRQQFAHRIIIFTYFNSNAALRHGGQHDFDWNDRGNLVRKAEPVEPSAGQERGLRDAVRKLPQSRFDIAAKRDDMEIGPQPLQLRGAAHR